MVKEPVIVNYIEISGELFRFDELEEEKKKEAVSAMEKRLMESLGYERMELDSGNTQKEEDIYAKYKTVKSKEI